MTSDQKKTETKYKLKFMPEAKAEWDSLDGSVKAPLKQLLIKRLNEPHVPGGELTGNLRGCYKIKLRQAGYRLVYQVEDGELVVLVVAIDKRENAEAYKSALARILNIRASAE